MSFGKLALYSADWQLLAAAPTARACLISRQCGLTAPPRATKLRAVHAPAKSPDSHAFVPDSGQAWLRLVLAVLIASIGAVGMWSVVVVMPTVQAEFATTRGAISFSVTMIFLGFGLGGVIMGRITDKVGIVAAMAVSIALLTIAYVLAGLSTALWQFIAISFLIGLGASATFAPLMAEASHWFERYRGLAVTIVASGNYVAGTIWPPIVNWGTQTHGWRATHIAAISAMAWRAAPRCCR
jgi:MFS family permease